MSDDFFCHESYGRSRHNIDVYALAKILGDEDDRGKMAGSANIDTANIDIEIDCLIDA